MTTLPQEDGEKPDRCQDLVSSLSHAVEAAEERFNVLFQETSDPILILSLEGDILSVNQGFERFTGIQPDPLFQGEKGWPDFIHEDDLPGLLTMLRRCADSDRHGQVETRVRDGEGFAQWFEIGVSVLHDEQRQARGLVAVARNINRRKELELQLREKADSMQKRHQRAQLLIAKLKHFFTRISALPMDIDGYLQGVCEVLADMYRPYAVIIRITDQDARLYRAGKSLPGDALDGGSEAMTQAILDTGMPLYCNTLNQTEPYRDDPSVRELGLITYLGGPLRDSTGSVRGALGIIDNEKRYFEHVDVELITVAALHLAARLRGEEQEKSNRELEDHLRQAQKMEAVGMLAGGVAHDFNNILSGILGFSSYLLSKADPASTLHRDLKLIEQSAVRAADLTRQLLSFARRKHFAKEAVQVNAVVREVLSLLGRSLPKQIVIREKLAEELPLVLGDPGQLNQIIMNLCLNAADAMAERKTGQLRIQTECRTLTEREHSILGGEVSAEYVCMEIKDNGVGMSLEVQEHLFEPFYTTKVHGEGTGLGLSIVYGIVTNHGGHILVDSEEGVGTTFTVYIPVYLGRERAPTEEAAMHLNGTETVLVVDDESIVRQMVTEVLRGYGYKVVAAESGMEAVHFMDRLRGRVDLVLLDIIMPDMDGEATYTALRRIDPVVPVLLTSGYVKEEKAARLLQRGAVDLISKPYKSEALLRRIRQILDAHPARDHDA